MTPSPTQLPIIILAFANDDRRSLRNLDEEQKELRQIFKQVEKERKCKILVLPAATVQDVVQAFQEYRNQVAVFHYGGHTDEDEIFFRTIYPQKKPVKADHLAEFFALQDGLQLVFLNSCLSLQQAEKYSSGGVRTVLATNDTIGDFAARNFAKLFYTAIASGSDIQEAYQEAEKSFQLQFDEVYRGLLFNPSGELFPWKLYPDSPASWRLPMTARHLTRVPTLQLEKEFIGREDELLSLKKGLENATRGILLNGLGGVGKTRLATAYVQKYGHGYDHIAWISQTEKQLISTLALNQELADTLNIPFEKEEENLNDRFNRVLWKLQQLHGQNLLVIDNVQEEVNSKEIYEHLPASSNWKVLLTSRLELSGFESIKLDSLNPLDGFTLFRTYFKGAYDETTLKLLLEEIGYHTLSIELLARLLNKSSSYLSLPNLLEIIQQKKLKEVNLQELIWTQHNKEERSILIHLMQAFEVSKLNKDEIWMLKQFAILPPNNISTAQLGSLLIDRLEFKFIEDQFSKKRWAGKLFIIGLQGLRSFVSEILILMFMRKLGYLSKFNKTEALSKLNQILSSLATKGWLKDNDKSGFSIHRIIQQVVRYQLRIVYKDLETLSAGLMNIMLGNPSENPMRTILPWVPHVEAVITFLHKKNSFSLKWLRTLLAIFYHGRLQNYDRAKELFELNLKLTQKKYHDGFKANLGEVYLRSGDHEKALKMITSIYQKRRRKYGIKSPLVAHIQCKLAWVYYEMSDFQKAVTLAEPGLEVLTKKLGKDSGSVRKFKSELALIYQAIHQYDRALLLQEELLEYELKNYAPDHPDLAVGQANTGVSYHRLGRYKEAADSIDQAIGIVIQNYGPEHPTVINLRNFSELIEKDLKNISQSE